MKVYDLSIPLFPGMVVWPDDPEMTMRPVSSTEAGDSSNVSHVGFSSHTGTHVDAPRHFSHGWKTLDQVPLDRFVGPARVVEIMDCGAIDAAALERASAMVPAETERVIFKTANTARQLLREPVFHKDYVAVTPEGARWLVNRGIRTVGVDYLSVERFRPEVHETHQTLLRADVLVIEGLDLREVPPGEYTLVCGTLKLDQGDGAPARVFLLPPYPA